METNHSLSLSLSLSLSVRVCLIFCQIVRYCEEGNFRLAHDEYLQAAIGNSAWPIGLTMVGIHERSGWFSTTPSFLTLSRQREDLHLQGGSCDEQ
jgi:hypothetical protein